MSAAGSTAGPVAGRAAWLAALPVAFEGAGFAVPISVGAITLLFAKIGPSLIAPGLLAALLAMVLLHLAGLRRGRTMVYAVRVLDVSLMMGLLDQFILKMPGWGLADTPAHRLMLVIAVSVGAAMLLPLFFALRLQRFARMIPAPAFAGFNTALGLTLLLSQGAVLWQSRVADGFWFVLVALLVLFGAIAAARLTPRLPPVVVGLTFGTLAALLLGVVGVHALGAVMQGQLQLVLPVFVVPWPALWADGVQTGAILRDLLLAALALALPLFLNTVVNEEAISQLDDAPPRARDWVATSAAGLLATLFGAPLLTPSIGASRSALRAGRLDGRALCLIAALVLAILGSGLLRLVPLAGICGLLLFDAWISFDRPSFRLGWLWLRGHRPALTEKEDLATVALVALTAVAFGLMTGVAIGVFVGLLLYAWRNGRRLTRTLATGATLQSNCARSRADLALLAEHAARVRFVALDGALYFGAASALQSLLREQFAPGRFVVVDWSHVVSADSTVANAFARLAAEAQAGGTQLAVSGLQASGSELGDTLRASGLSGHIFPDADRALEWAENGVIAGAAPAQAGDVTSLREALSLMRGLSREHRDELHELLEQRFLRAGETIFSAGDADNALMVILEGSVDILVRHSEGRDVRLARLRRGGMLGELSFLDNAPRAATTVATEDLTLGVLSRERFEAFARERPEAGRRVLTNMALDLALRMRRTTHLAVNSLR